MARSTDVLHFCVRGGAPSSLCCHALHEAARSGGLFCICEIAYTPALATSGYTAASLLAAYTSCGGDIRVDSRLATKCGAESFLLDDSGPSRHLPDDSGYDDSDEDDVISPPPPKRSHHHRRQGHQTQEVDAMEDEDNIPHHRESWADKLERVAQILGAILPSVTALALVIYIMCAGSGNRVDRAKSLVKALAPLLPVMVEHWIASKTKTASETTTTPVMPRPSVSVEADATIAMGIAANPNMDLVPVTRPKSP